MNRPVTFLKKCFDKLADRWMRDQIVKPKPANVDVEPQPMRGRGGRRTFIGMDLGFNRQQPRRQRKQHAAPTGGYSGNSHQRRLQRRVEERVTGRMQCKALSATAGGV